jgi:hypothetical protein
LGSLCRGDRGDFGFAFAATVTGSGAASQLNAP